MDRNSIIGLSLIFLLFVGYWFINKPSDAEMAQQQHFNDSMAMAEKAKLKSISLISAAEQHKKDSIANALLNDSNALSQKFGGLAQHVKGNEQFYTLENSEMKITLSSKGGSIKQIQLKKYKRADSTELFLLSKESVHQLEFQTRENTIKTGDFYWEVKSADAQNAVFRLNYSPSQYIEHTYHLGADGFNLDHQIKTYGLNSLLVPNTKLILQWNNDVPLQEYEREKERILTAVYFKYPEEKADYMGETKFDEMRTKQPTEWVSFKQQFFNTTIMAKEPFLKESLLKSDPPQNEKNVEHLTAHLELPYKAEAEKTFDLKFYFGPNKFKLLKDQNVGLEKIIPLGWGIFGWINRFMIIPIFNFLSGFLSNYGIIILLLTLIVKTLLLPLVYRSYKSTAKMKLLKPEMDAIKEKNKDNMQAAQMENLALYKKVGVNPLGGCLPLLLQMPILVAVFQFVPSAFEFRQQSFLWATDLSHYDSIFNFPDYPILMSIYGNHVSLFTLLMTISTLIYTRMNNQMTGVNEQMKWIGYLMPIMFLGFFNSYAAALSYYYFLSNCVTFTQQWAIKKFVDEDKLHAQLNEARSKNGTNKKSAFQMRLEEMSKSRGLDPNTLKKKK